MTVSLLVSCLLSFDDLPFCLMPLVQMAFQLLPETTALYVSGMPQLLREIRSHLYPAAPAPKYHVFNARFDETHSEFSATVYLRTTPLRDGDTYAFSSRITTQVNRAI